MKARRFTRPTCRITSGTAKTKILTRSLAIKALRLPTIKRRRKGRRQGQEGKSDEKKKEEKDVQLDRAIDILKHWNTLQAATGQGRDAA